MNKKKETFYFVGIGGTGMSSTAGLMRELGHNVTGSDQDIYEPTKSLLETLNIPIKVPYSKENILESKADTYIIANSLSRGNLEIETIMQKDLAFTSFPELLKNKILKTKKPIVIGGTHGKTTTTSLLSYCLKELGEEPGYLIGGICKSLEKNFATGNKLFVLEGDEYDTAFFDKKPKLFHYIPEYLVLNNIEFDHADIYSDVNEIKAVFTESIKMVSNPSHLIVNIDNPKIAEIITQLKIQQKVRTTSHFEQKNQTNTQIVYSQASLKKHISSWATVLKTPLGQLEIMSSLWGKHNSENIAQVVASLIALQQDHLISPFSLVDIKHIIENFKGVAKRLDPIGSFKKGSLYLDFAHHPSAVASTIQTIKNVYPKKNIIAVFEPKNATSRRNIFMDEYKKAFLDADVVCLAPCQQDTRIEEHKRMSTTQLAKLIGVKATAFSCFESLFNWLKKNISANDIILFMSSGNFAQIPLRLIQLNKVK